MKITAIIENETLTKGVKASHGLSLYIETKKHRILFDAGTKGLFENAKKLNIDLTKIDSIIISHGHCDHTGGLRKLLKMNPHAKVYLKKDALEKHYLKVFGIYFDISINEKIEDFENRAVLVDDFFEIDDELILFSNVISRDYWSMANNVLYKKENGKKVLDDFSHEQNLVIKEQGEIILISGCCHNGIINTLNRLNEFFLVPTYVISGFHFLNLDVKKEKVRKVIEDISKVLMGLKNTKYYTCHCTGKDAYQIMKEKMGKQIEYLYCGNSIEV